MQKEKVVNTKKEVRRNCMEKPEIQREAVLIIGNVRTKNSKRDFASKVRQTGRFAAAFYPQEDTRVLMINKKIDGAYSNEHAAVHNLVKSHTKPLALFFHSIGDLRLTRQEIEEWSGFVCSGKLEIYFLCGIYVAKDSFPLSKKRIGFLIKDAFKGECPKKIIKNYNLGIKRERRARLIERAKKAFARHIQSKNK